MARTLGCAGAPGPESTDRKVVGDGVDHPSLFADLDRERVGGHKSELQRKSGDANPGSREFEQAVKASARTDRIV